VTLNINQIPPHTHPAQATSGGGTSNNPAGNVWANWTGSQYSDQGAGSPLNTGVIGSVGNTQPHDNMMPFLAVSFIISLFGIFPSQT
jgi:microcystin-dependent protein